MMRADNDRGWMGEGGGSGVTEQLNVVSCTEQWVFKNYIRLKHSFVNH